MAPRVTPKNQKQSKTTPSSDPHGMFHGMVVFLVSKSIQLRRLQIWKQRLMQMGAVVDEQLSKRITHIFAADSSSLRSQVNREYLKEFKGKLFLYDWLEKSLQSGKRLSEDAYTLKVEPEEVYKPRGNLDDMHHKKTESNSSHDESFQCKRTRISHEDTEAAGDIGRGNIQEGSEVGKLIKRKDQAGCLDSGKERLNSQEIPSSNIYTHSSYTAASPSADGSDEHKEIGDSQSIYSPPDLNRNITEIFGKLITIYRALGDDRRSFSYYKAIPVIEKLPFQIESVDQVKHLPTIGKSMQDHINEILTTGKLSKLEHFEKDEKVRTVTLFGEVWGIGPATALKLYEKGHRSLDDLKNDESLTNSQRIGLQFFDDIKKRIPRHEVKDMEMLLQKVGEEILPGVVIVCGGSYRRGKASCGDLDIIITHPDGESHKGFLPRFVQRLKEINFLREDLVFSTHSTEGTDSGVDTYFGLCTYPGRELRHRIDLKVYPRNIYAFGLIAWTGNDVLNRRLRLLAESKGYRLDDTGLFLATQSSSGKRGTKSRATVSCSTEKEVFDVLGFPWLEPHERNL